MTVLSVIYSIIIEPLKYLFEYIFALSGNYLKPASSLLTLSLAINLLVLPLYRRADALQEQQRDIEKKMAPDLAFLKRTFKGDERVMMIQTYYRQHNYKPIYALKGSLSLLLEIPFFIAAYQFLSNLNLLSGVSFGPIADLAAPDAMLTLAGYSINVLPVLMTAINLVSGYIYSKGYPLKTKLQLYGIALIFLVFLYDSPAGLVFYWTLNNLFSLGKNIFNRLIRNAKNPQKYRTAFYGAVISCFMIAAKVAKGYLSILFFLVLFTVCFFPVFRESQLSAKIVPVICKFKNRMDGSSVLRLFSPVCAFLTICLGYCISGVVLLTAPMFFTFLKTDHGPFFLLLLMLTLFVGLFLWFSIFYCFAVCFFPPLREPRFYEKLMPVFHKDRAPQNEKTTHRLFFAGSVFLALLWGLYIPTSVISASPTEFTSINYGPFYLIFHTFFLYVGLFLWVSVFYYLSGKTARRIYATALWAVSGSSLLNFFFYGKYGSMSAYLVYDKTPVFSGATQWINLAVVILAVFLLLRLFRKLPKLVRWVYPVLAVAIVIVSAVSWVDIQDELNRAELSADRIDRTGIKPILSLSAEGKNVVVIMLDRAIGEYVPYIMNEFPELADSFEGFTWYSNTLSYSGCTNFSTPALFGGYEYSPYASNQRDTVALSDKQNEALHLMPVLFRDSGYEVTVCDLPYAGYSFVPDMSVFDEDEGISAHSTIGHYASSYEKTYGQGAEVMQQNHFFFYSLFRSVPVCMEPVVFQNGRYGVAERGTTVSSGYLAASAVMENLCALTEFTNNDSAFLMLQNDITHNPILLSAPDYCPDEEITEEEVISYYQQSGIGTVNGQTMLLEDTSQISHYQVNVAAYQALAAWLDYLKECGVYDNTRIIIVSDHGMFLTQFEKMQFENDIQDMERYNSLLLVKDFDSHTELTEDSTFMTIADVPTLATEEVIENPVNPFTGNEISSSKKETDPVYITTSGNWDTDLNHGNTFDTSDGEWYQFTGTDIFDESSWIKVDEP